MGGGNMSIALRFASLLFGNFFFPSLYAFKWAMFGRGMTWVAVFVCFKSFDGKDFS